MLTSTQSFKRRDGRNLEGNCIPFSRLSFRHFHRSSPQCVKDPSASSKVQAESPVTPQWQSLHEQNFERLSGFFQSHQEEAVQDDIDGTVKTGAEGTDATPQLVQRGSQLPSAHLLSALRGDGLGALIRKPGQQKTDLSFYDARTYEAKARDRTGLTVYEPKIQDVSSRSLQDVLATYIRHGVDSLVTTGDKREPQSSFRDLSVVGASPALDLVMASGHVPEDLEVWSWIVTSDSANTAAKRISTATRYLSSLDRKPVPLFVILLLLRSSSANLSASSLKLILDCMWLTSASSKGNDFSDTLRGNTSGNAGIILVVRLLRHARKAWPEALSEIAALAVKMFEPGSSPEQPLALVKAQRMCHVYNRLLTLLALPLSLAPNRAIPLQQQAQMRLIRSMVSTTPQLPVTREGFRALASIQVAHRKTENEKRWARVKALSWPPWREEKLGINENDDVLGSYSRAMDVLSRMTEAGYSKLSWERRLQIFAGWDTDDSPTIQLRQVQNKAPVVPSDMSADRGLGLGTERDGEIWAARISATRTIREAWACFCSCEQAGASHSLEPWSAMLEKLFNNTDRSLPEDVVPGDGRETMPEPTSPRHFVYVPTEPPSVLRLYNRMLSAGVKPAGRLLASLLDHAPDLEFGLKCISDSRFNEVRRGVLLSAEKYTPDYIRDTTTKLPGYLFAAYVRLLGRFSDHTAIVFEAPASASTLDGKLISGKQKRATPLNYARRLVEISQTQHVPVWNALISGLHLEFRRSETRRTRSKEPTWGLLRRLVDFRRESGLAPGLGIFQEFWPLLEELILNTAKGPSFPMFLKSALRIARSMFRDNVVADRSADMQWLPNHPDASILSVPSPANLHGLIRILIVTHNGHLLIPVVRWMDRFARELEEVSKELSGGQRMMRRNMILLRIGLEEGWIDGGVQVRGTEAAKETVERHGEWGGWPSDADVREHLEQHAIWYGKIEAVRRHLAAEESKPTAKG